MRRIIMAITSTALIIWNELREKKNEKRRK